MPDEPKKFRGTESAHADPEYSSCCFVRGEATSSPLPDVSTNRTAESRQGGDDAKPSSCGNGYDGDADDSIVRGRNHYRIHGRNHFPY